MKKTIHVKTNQPVAKRHIESLILQNGYDVPTSIELGFGVSKFESDYYVFDSHAKNTKIICCIDVLGSFDKSAFISFYSSDPVSETAEFFYDKVLQHFAELDLIVPPKKPEPWKQSSKEKQGRDKIIWEARQALETWEKTAELANVSVTTAKESYNRMQKSLESGELTDSG